MSHRQRRRRADDRTQNRREFLITGSWDNNPDDPTRIPTRDPREARRVARSLASKAAYVIVEEFTARRTWVTAYELDGPALVAEQGAAEAALAAGWPPAPADYRPDADDRHRTWLAEQFVADNLRVEARTRAEALAAEQAARRRRIASELARTSRQLMTAPPEARPDYRRAARHMTGAQR
ncbi:hypothetical protein ACWGN5_07565 [Streptomyces sp. NPDC055815]